MGNRGIFDEDIRLAKLSELGDSLVKLNRVINWEMFRPLLEKATHKEKKGVGGRPPFDCVLMFKVLVLQRIYNLSDDQTEYQINDRMSFMRLSRRPSGLRKTTTGFNSLAHRTTWLRSDFM